MLEKLRRRGDGLFLAVREKVDEGKKGTGGHAGQNIRHEREIVGGKHKRTKTKEKKPKQHRK